MQLNIIRLKIPLKVNSKDIGNAANSATAVLLSLSLYKYLHIEHTPK